MNKQELLEHIKVTHSNGKWIEDWTITRKICEKGLDSEETLRRYKPMLHELATEGVLETQWGRHRDEFRYVEQ